MKGIFPLPLGVRLKIIPQIFHYTFLLHFLFAVHTGHVPVVLLPSVQSLFPTCSSFREQPQIICGSGSKHDDVTRPHSQLDLEMRWWHKANREQGREMDCLARNRGQARSWDVKHHCACPSSSKKEMLRVREFLFVGHVQKRSRESSHSG